MVVRETPRGVVGVVGLRSNGAAKSIAEKYLLRRFSNMLLVSLPPRESVSSSLSSSRLRHCSSVPLSNASRYSSAGASFNVAKAWRPK